jgi:hypothetical protein
MPESDDNDDDDNNTSIQVFATDYRLRTLVSTNQATLFGPPVGPDDFGREKYHRPHSLLWQGVERDRNGVGDAWKPHSAQNTV